MKTTFLKTDRCHPDEIEYVAIRATTYSSDEAERRRKGVDNLSTGKLEDSLIRGTMAVGSAYL